jgi:hypothetical protein
VINVAFRAGNQAVVQSDHVVSHLPLDERGKSRLTLGQTDMGGPSARLSPEEGVETIVWAATLEGDGPTGGFFRYKQPIPW